MEESKVMTESQSIVLAGLSDLAYGDLSPERLGAFESLSSGSVPRSAVREHIGKGGKKFSYVDHVWVTQQLRAAFGQLWEFEVSNPQIHPDGTATVICKLTVHFKFRTIGDITTSVTEIGAWEDSTGKMPMAMRLASAASRGLVRCAFRKFGIGEEFYNSDNPEITAQDCWRQISALASKHGIGREVAIDALKAAGISMDNLVERFVEAYKIIYQMGTGTE